MYKRSSFLLVFLLAAGCGQKPTPQNPSAKKPNEVDRAEYRVGGAEDDEPRHLSFRITSVYEKQKPSTNTPFHVDGGEWTYFDCEAITDSKVRFTVGVMTKGGGSVPIAWGRAVLGVKDRETGGMFVELFRKSFSGKMPTPVKQPYVSKPLFVNTAILGENIQREANGGFAGKGGDWTATKWFPEFDERSGEVFFNYNLNKRQGEFSEKDADYADDLLSVFASALRDGPRPERTPENDSNLTLVGPTIGPPRKLLARRAAHCSFNSMSTFAVFQDDSAIFALPIDVPDGKPVEIARFDHSPWEIRIVDDELDLLAQEGIPENPGIKSSGDPMRFWWVDQKSKQKKLLWGPEKDTNLANAAVSPDHRYVAFNQWRNSPGKDGRTEVLHILNRESGTEKVFELRGKNLSLIGWKGTETGLRAVVVTNCWRLDKKEASETYLADPSTGTLERQEHVEAQLEINNPASPDEKHRFRVGKDDLVVTDVTDGSQHRFVFHEDDRRFVGEECVEWVSPRYLKFGGPRLALIDITTMKMCFPTSTDGKKLGSHTYTFSPNFRWVLYQGDGNDEEGLFLSSVEMPKAP